MQALDGNSIAGDLTEVFGRDMTTTSGACANCGTVALIAELAVYSRAPGTVVRCRHCGEVVMVLVSVRGSVRLDAGRFDMSPS